MIHNIRMGLTIALAGFSLSLLAPMAQANTAAQADPPEYAQIQQMAQKIQSLAKQRQAKVKAYNDRADSFRAQAEALNQEMSKLLKAIKEKSAARQDFTAERNQLKAANQKMDGLLKSFFPTARDQVNSIFTLERQRQQLQQEQATRSMDLSKKQIERKLAWLLAKQKEDFTVVRRNQIYKLNRYLDQLSIKQTEVVSALSGALNKLEAQQRTLLGQLVPSQTPPSLQPQ